MPSGIYRIVCSENGKIYVGSAKDFADRWRRHLHALTRGTHHSVTLQRAWNLYGPDKFRFEIVEECAVDCLLDREQSVLDSAMSYQPERGYNICPKVGSRLGVKLSPEQRKRISDAQRGRVVSPEQRAKISATLSGRPKSPEHNAKVGTANKGKTWGPERRAKLMPMLQAQGVARRGIPCSPESIEKRRIAHTGKRLTEAHCLSIGHSRRRFSDQQVIEMVEMTRIGVKQKIVAEKFNCDPSIVSKIVRGKRKSYGGVLSPANP